MRRLWAGLPSVLTSHSVCGPAPSIARCPSPRPGSSPSPATVAACFQLELPEAGRDTLTHTNFSTESKSKALWEEHRASTSCALIQSFPCAVTFL